MSETVTIPVQKIEVFTNAYSLKVKAVMTISDMRETVIKIAAVLPGDTWKELMAEINGEDVCGEGGLSALRKIAALEGCECDSYHGFRCLMCEVRSIANGALREE